MLGCGNRSRWVNVFLQIGCDQIRMHAGKWILKKNLNCDIDVVNGYRPDVWPIGFALLAVIFAIDLASI